jgi:hypothetical protein
MRQMSAQNREDSSRLKRLFCGSRSAFIGKIGLAVPQSKLLAERAYHDLDPDEKAEHAADQHADDECTRDEPHGQALRSLPSVYTTPVCDYKVAVCTNKVAFCTEALRQSPSARCRSAKSGRASGHRLKWFNQVWRIKRCARIVSAASSADADNALIRWNFVDEVPSRGVCL